MASTRGEEVSTDDRPAWDVEYARSQIDELRPLATKDNDRRLRKLADQLEAHLARLSRNEIDKLALLDAFESSAHDALDSGDLSTAAGGQIDDIREAIRRLQPRAPGARPDPVAVLPPPSPPTPPPPPPGPPGPPGPPNPTSPGPAPTTPGPTPMPNPTPAPGTPPPGGDQTDDGAGTKPDRNLKGDPTTPPVTPPADVMLPGSPNATPSRRTVIKAAATHGFAMAPYKVYSEYRSQREAVMRNDKLPTSYRYYIKRYFQRIKPD